MSLTGGFFFLILASLSGYSSNGSFADMPMADGIYELPLFVNMILFVLNFYICVRLIGDERPFYISSLNEEEMALYRFFQSRCGLGPLQFKEILSNGKFVELPAGTEVPHCSSTLYLVLEGKVSCKARLQDKFFGRTFEKRSGEFFDIKLFNLFSLPVGFDNVEFHAKSLSTTKFFAWDIHGIIAMRESSSPSLKEYWEYMVLRSLTASAIRHDLNNRSTLYDSLLVPEHESWLEGAPSRDFWFREKPTGNWQHLQRQLRMLRGSLMNIIPPHGVRQHPGLPLGTNPKQAYLELQCKAAASEPEGSSQGGFRFLKTLNEATENKDDHVDEEAGVVEQPPLGLFCKPDYSKR